MNIGIADLSPSISPDQRKIAVASFPSFEKDAGWCGEIEDLQTNIIVIDLDNMSERKIVVEDGGWPTWGSNDTLYFHRNSKKVKMDKCWGVFQVIMHEGANSETRVTPENITAITPTAIDASTVAVATIREPSNFGDHRREAQYRHIEVFEVCSDTNEPLEAKEKLTPTITPLADHFNPFVIVDDNGDRHIGYHRCKVIRFLLSMNCFNFVFAKLIIEPICHELKHRINQYLN